MLGLLAAALATAASPAPDAPTVAVPPSAPAAPGAAPAPALETAMPWWERITVTVDDKGQQQSCRYQTSLSPSGAEACDKAMAESLKVGGEGRSGVFKKVTFERRFSPGRQLDAGKLEPGDTLLGRQVMFLTIDASGAIRSCDVVETSGETRPAYDCDAVRKEHFKAEGAPGRAARSAFMTVLAYGHAAQIA